MYNIYIDNTQSPEKVEKLKVLNAELYTYVEQFKAIMKDYMEGGRIEVVKPAIEIYLNYIVPIAEKIRNTTYVYNGVEYDENTNEYLLIQQISTIKNSEINIERAQVISFSK
jgi:delta-aminolevulinic acid dehydratase/porphobilinogen synthase